MNILQDILGLFKRKKIVKTLQSNDYIPLGTFKSKKEALKPNPKMETVIISAIDLKNYTGGGGGGTGGGYIQTATTVNATPFLLTSSKAIATNSVQSFVTRVTAIATATGDVWCHEFRGAIKQFGGATSIVGTVTDEMIAEDVVTATWGAAITAAPGSMSITVTGAAVNIKWKAETTFSEVLI
jgi:hypothetical protein